MTGVLLPRAVVDARPEACALLAAARARAAQTVDAVALAKFVRARLGIGPAAVPPLPEPVDTFVEQFVVQVSGVSPEMVAALAAHIAPQPVDEWVRAWYTVEFAERLMITTSRLFEGPVIEVSPDDGQAVTMRAALGAYQDAVMRGTDLDPALTEMVRLRCARTHRCTICSTLRLSSARDAGVDESVTAKVDFYETSDLPERTKVALRVVDAFINHPSALTADLVEQARTAFTDVELAELCLDVTKWSTQKINVALGTDGIDRLTVNADGVIYFDFDEVGRPSAFSAG